MANIIVTGGSSGLGACIVSQLIEDGHNVFDWSIETGVNVMDLQSIQKAADCYGDGDIDILINCAGVNIINWFEKLTEGEWEKVMGVNAKALWLVTKDLLPQLRGGTVLNIVSNASHMPMTHSAFYNASKGAAEILTRQMARELGKTHDLTVFGISPNRLKNTGMTDYINERVCDLRDWTPEEAMEYQLKALPAGEETDPQTLAEFIAFLLSDKQRHKYLQGCIIPYGV